MLRPRLLKHEPHLSSRILQVLTGERISKHIRNAEKAKTPVMCVVGQAEVDSGEALPAQALHCGLAVHDGCLCMHVTMRRPRRMVMQDLRERGCAVLLMVWLLLQLQYMMKRALLCAIVRRAWFRVCMQLLCT